MTTVPAIVLRGREHTELGRVVGEAFGATVGIAISAGAVADSHAHLDPNEDGVLAGCVAGSILLAVVDGNGGTDASDAALTAVARVLGDDRTPVPGGEARWLLELRDIAMAAAANARRGHPRAHASDTALSLALIGDDQVVTTSIGDTGVVLLGERVEILSGIAPHLGHTAEPALSHRRTIGRVAHVVVASDGFFDALGRAWVEVMQRSLLEGAPWQAAARVVEQACRAGADDNVSVAIAQVGAPSDDRIEGSR